MTAIKLLKAFVSIRSGSVRPQRIAIASTARESRRGPARKRCSKFMNLEQLIRFQAIPPQGG
jgi:hypothetical protein